MIVTVLGWGAAASLLIGYRLVTIGKVSGESVSYLLLNLFGSVGLGVSTAVAHAWPSAAVNVIWLGLGVGPLVKSVRAVRGRADFPGGARLSAPEPATSGERPGVFPGGARLSAPEPATSGEIS